MLINMILPGTAGGAGGEPFGFTYSGIFTDNRDADGKGTVRLNTSGTLNVVSGTATVIATIVGGGGGGAQHSGVPTHSASGGGGGIQEVEVTLEAGTYDIVIGTGGAGIAGPRYGTAGTGGNTTAFGKTSTGGKGGTSAITPSAGAGGTPNGGNGSIGWVVGGSPNGGASNGGSPGGDGYVELTFS